ncbi:hypothetical protein NGM37_24470, partial [Streptomyces sp. TRM76130]|nr:hypothetical protein [Streptomyces sp. TRM76130]
MSTVPGLTEVHGYGWLAYNHGAAPATVDRLHPNILSKNLLVAASRTPFLDIREALSPNVQQFLAANHEWVVNLFTGEVRTFVATRRAAVGHPPVDTSRILDEMLPRRTATLRQYLATMFTPVPEEH